MTCTTKTTKIGLYPKRYVPNWIYSLASGSSKLKALINVMTIAGYLLLLYENANVTLHCADLN